MQVGLINLYKGLFSLNANIYYKLKCYIDNICVTHTVHIISLLVETSVPLVHETMDTSPKKVLGCVRKHSSTVSRTSSLFVNRDPFSAFLVARTHGKSQGDRSVL